MFYNSLTLAHKEVRANEWVFSHDYAEPVRISEENLYRFLETPFKFRLLVEERPGTRLQFAAGQVSFEQLLMREAF